MEGSMAPNTFEGPWVIGGVTYTKAQLAQMPEAEYVTLMALQRMELKNSSVVADHGGSDYVPDPVSASRVAAEEGGDQWSEDDHRFVGLSLDAQAAEVSVTAPVHLPAETTVMFGVPPIPSFPRRDREHEVVYGVKVAVFGDDDSVERTRQFLERKLTAIMHGDVTVTVDHFVPGPLS